MMKKLLLSMLTLMACFHLFAQRLITGMISDGTTKEALIGANVIVKGTNSGTVADVEGKYTLTVSNNARTLVFSYSGYAAQEVQLGTSDNIDIELRPGTSLEDVVVIGTRSQPRTATNSSVPVDVISAKELKSFSQVDVGQILNYVAPSFNSNRQTVADGTDHLDPASLRGLGPDQVLVLVNGKRRHTSALVNINGTVGRGAVGTDMNVIPVAAIERIEVLRDGAAAQYGSDAIAGVINVVLKKNYEGLSASVTTGMNVTNMKYTVPTLGGGSSEVNKKINDGGVVQVDLTKGFRLGSKGSLTTTLAFNERGKTNRSGEDNAPSIFYGANAGFPATPAGQTEADFRNKILTDDAAWERTNNYNRQNMIFGNSASRNIGAFINGELPQSDRNKLYFASGFTYRTGKGFGNNRVPVSRAQQPLKADGSLLYPTGFLPAIESEIQDLSLILGYKLGLGKWDLDLSNTTGQNSFGFGVSSSGNASLANADNQQTAFDAGKLSFLQNTTNIDMVRGFENRGALSNMNLAFGGELRYEKFNINAGEEASYSGANAKKTVNGAPIFAGGANNGTTLALPGSQVFPGFQPSDEVNKNRTSAAFYTDVEGELASRVLVGLAGRFENYSDFGSNVSGKVTTRIKIVDAISLRGSASTGFRAPSLHQRYFQNTSTQFVSGVPSNTLTVNNDNDIARKFIGVDALRPETSQSVTAGITAKAGTFSATVDAYQINIKDRIVYSGAFSRSLLGFTADQYVGINNVNFFANAADTRTKGIDVVLNNRSNIGKGTLTATVALNFNQNEVTAVKSTTLIDDPKKNDPTKTPDDWFRNRLFDRQQISRIEVFQPNNKINVSLTYSIKKFDFTVRAVRFGAVTYVHNVDTEAKKADGTFWSTAFSRDANGAAYIDQTFDPVLITDLVIGYRLNSKFSINVGANNLLDVYPDQIYIDPRNARGSTNYSAGRDASNRGRLLFQPNQGGYNGRFLFLRLAGNF